jgi:negative regulator of flagellin synthesis FlgM
MSSIDTRPSFFPRSRSAQAEKSSGGRQVEGAERNTMERTSELQAKTAGDARVNIPDGVKDFSRIKKAAMSAPETDNSEKIARLKAQIQAGTYEVDYDGLADKILTSEF